MVLGLQKWSYRIRDCSKGVGGMGRLMVMEIQKVTGLDVFERDELMAW